MAFNDRDYTADAVIKQLGLIELHCKDGSAVEAGCQCIDTKHLFLLEGLSEEGQGFALSEKERQFYAQLATLVRGIRKRMEVEDWNLHGVMRETMKTEHPTPKHASENPRTAEFLPHHLTEYEKTHPGHRKKLSSCIRQVELACCGEYTPDYSVCTCNPVAVCRASLKA